MNSWLRPSTALYRLLPPLTALLGGGATLGKLSFKEPAVHLERIDITGLSLGCGTLGPAFVVARPETLPLPPTRAAVDLELEAGHVAAVRPGPAPDPSP